MIFKGFRLPEGIIRDMDYICCEVGMSKSQMVRNGLQLVINDYFQKEKIKQDHIDKQNRTRPAKTENYISLFDGW